MKSACTMAAFAAFASATAATAEEIAATKAAAAALALERKVFTDEETAAEDALAPL